MPIGAKLTCHLHVAQHGYQANSGNRH